MPPATSGASRKEIGQAGIEGVRWLGAARGVAEVAGFGATVVLARLIPPADFGQFAVVAIIILLAGSLAGDGLTAPLVRMPEAGRVQLEGASFVAVVGGLTASAAVFGVATLIRASTGSELAELAQIASPYFLIAALGAVPRAQLQRGLEFRRLGAMDTVAPLLGLGTSIGLAVAGLDAEALILGALVGQAAAVAMAMRASPLPFPRRGGDTTELKRFGGLNAAAGVASTFSQNVDYAVLAARAEAATVGFYWRGYQLGVETQRKLSGVLATLGLPLYSRLADHQSRLALRSRIVRLQTMVIAPFLVALILLAPILVPAIFGQQWEPAVLPTQILAGAGLLSAAQTGIGPLIAAIGRPEAMLRWNLSNIVVLGVGVYVAAPHGLVVLSVTVLGLRTLRFIAAYEFLLRRIAEVPLGALIRDLAPAAIAATAAAGAAVAAQHAFLFDLAEISEIAGVGVALAITYPLVLAIASREAFAELTSALGRLTRTAKP